MTNQGEPATARSSPRRRLAPALLAAAIAIAYWPTLRAPFLFDDTAAILRNPTIRHLGSLAALSPPADGGTTTGRPLVNFTFAINYALSGEDPWSYHALNLVIHALAALTLFGLVRQTLRSLTLRGQFGAVASPLAFFSTLLWAVHPLLTESVACAAQRTESLCGLFYLFTLYAFVRGAMPLEGGARCPQRAWLALSVVAGLAGMATKEVMVTAPLVVLLYDRTLLSGGAMGKFSAALRLRPRYYAALAATWLVLVVLVARSGGARGAAAGFGLGVSAWSYLLTQCDALVLYLKLALWPHPLVLDYGTAVVTSLSAIWWQAALIVGLLTSTVAAVCDRRVSIRAVGFLGAWFFLILAPSSSFIPLVTQTIAEHRMYLPLAAVLVALALAAHRLLESRATPVLALVALVAGGVTFARNRDYASEITIWEGNVAARPHARVLTALGVAQLHAGRPADALRFFTRALALDATHLAAQRNRALALLQLGRADEAASILAALPVREAGEASEYFALGNAFAREEKYAEARAAYVRAVALEPTHAAAHANLGNVLLLLGRPREALAEYETVLRLRPDDARARENLQTAREALR